MKPLSKQRVLVTSGPTQEPMDPVRYLSNYSSGKQGHAIAEACAALGAEVVLVSGPVSLPDPEGVKVVHIQRAEEMLAACLVELGQGVDVAICAAAVSDWRFEEISPNKRKKEAGVERMSVTLIKNPDILEAISKHPNLRPKLVVGFAAETDNILEHAKAKLARKGCDWIVANDVSAAVFGAEENTVHLVTRSGAIEAWPTMSKKEVAKLLAERVGCKVLLKGPLSHGER